MNMLQNAKLQSERVAKSIQASARLAQSAERKALNLVVVGSSPTVGVLRKHVSFLFAPLAEQKIHLARIELATFSVLG